uniref:Trafficking protein particle complex subunit 2-like protein n=2 Tax=Elaeis guineensis var. tenera TaxID=51953 RepID=A0A6I9S8H4_ELAGV|nr:trafficking protein particle complex subunit 2-like protein isoform X2 [Elaeis guineensis]
MQQSPARSEARYSVGIGVADSLLALFRPRTKGKAWIPELRLRGRPAAAAFATKMIVCVAVVGHQNNPLYLQSFTEADDALKLHHIIHCSLDVIDERINNPKKSGPTLNEAFLGLLYPTENYKVYGYLTNTKVKFIMVTTDLDVKDADFFRRFHAAYVDAVSNPFHVPGKKITSKAFAQRVSSIVKSFGSAATT